MKKLAYSTAGKTVDQTLGFIRLMIGEDMPHTKFSGHGCYSKDWLVLNAIQSKYIVIEDSGMLSVCGNESFLKEKGYIEVDYCGEPINNTQDNKWDGEGLPPVGVECDIYCAIDPTLPDGDKDWMRTEIVAVTDCGFGAEETVVYKTKWSAQWYVDAHPSRSLKFRKVETPQEKANRERDENAIAYFEFETQCFREAGENDQLLTDSWEQADSVAKEAYRIMAEKLNFKPNLHKGE